MKKKFVYILLMVCILSNLFVEKAFASDELYKETKAVWITTVYNQDWPSESSKNNPDMQKKEFINIINDVKSLGFNTIMIQVRPKGDALYQSSINPWSDVLTGVQGKYPGYDPLKFVIDESHKRGIKVHAWFNPYRVTTSGTDLNKLASNHYGRKNPNLILSYNNKSLVYNPGLPEVRSHIADTVAEVVKNYDVDGIHFDDYFYPGSEVNDYDAYKKYGIGEGIENFRRSSVNKMVREVYKTIKSIDNSVEFGISPRGIWKNKSSDSTGSDTRGAESYYDIYADTRTWIKYGWLDYVVPQIYWERGNSAADYNKLIPWWVNEVKGTKTKLYIGQGVYKPIVASEIKEQVKLNRQYEDIKGSVYFSYRDIKNNVSSIRSSLNEIYNKPFTVTDISKLSISYNTVEGKGNWNAYYDINRDGIIDIYDMVLIASRL